MNETYLNQINEDLKKSCPEKDQYYFGHGKLLLTGEYFVLDGAQALALPTKLGQSLSVKYQSSYSPALHWKSYDVAGNCWFDSKFEFWHFKCMDENPSEEALLIQKLLQQVRKQNPHFLRDGVDVLVETRLGFPLNWGLGSSSTLIYNIAQWAYVSPFELLFKTHGGSGYDIACAQSEAPIMYKKTGQGPNWSPTIFNPQFKENLFFVYQGIKKNSRDAIKEYNKKKPIDSKIIQEVTDLSNKILNALTLEEFQNYIVQHEKLVSEVLQLPTVKSEKFSDFDGEIKSLGAWGGDFVLAATNKPLSYFKEYFKGKGLDTALKFDDIVTPSFKTDFSDTIKINSNHLVH